MELGGKNGVVVLADADLDLAADGILWSAFGTTGQRCTACSRVIVERSVVDALLQRLEARARTLRLGSGLDESTDVGPLINGGALDKVASYIDVGRAEGELVIGGGRATAGDLAHGHFFEPTIFAGVGPMDRIGQEEIFGPVLSVIPVADYGEAMLALNQTRYGLSSSIFTRDVNQAFRAMRDFETGIVYVNAGTTGAETHLPVRRLEGDRQRAPRGRPRRARHLHRVEVDLRRLQRAPPARADRQPAVVTDATSLPDHVQRNRTAWDEWAHGVRRRRRARVARSRSGEETWGIWGIPESSLQPAPGRSRRARTRSSSAAGPATCRRGWRAAAPARSASTTPSSSSRPPDGSRPSTASTFPLLHGNAEARAVPGRELRPRHLRVRREHLGRPVSLGPRGRAAAAPGRPSSSSS